MVTPSTSDDRRRTRRRVVGCSIAAASVIAAAVSTMANSGHDGDRTSAARPVAPPPVTASVPPSDEPSTTGPIHLPQPTSYVDGVPTGYPRTIAGAIAAAYGYSRVASGLDVETTLGAVEAFADPAAEWFAPARATLADGLVAQRRELGLAPVGSTGSANLTVTPTAYRVEDSSDLDSPTVLTLNVLSAVSADGARTSGVVVLRWPLRWDGTRWLVTGIYSSPDDAALAVTPSTTQAQHVGWKVARGG